MTDVAYEHQDHELTADWTVMFRHWGRWDGAKFIIDPDQEEYIDDSDGPTEFWCLTCDTEVAAPQYGYE